MKASFFRNKVLKAKAKR